MSQTLDRFRFPGDGISAPLQQGIAGEFVVLYFKSAVQDGSTKNLKPSGVSESGRC
jgi:hypothetical protein